MPSLRNSRKGTVEEKSTTKKGKSKSIYRASSFHGQESNSLGEIMRRPRTVPNLLTHATNIPTPKFGSNLPQAIEIQEQESGPKKLPKLLLNVTIQRSLGPVHVVMLPDSTVGDLIASAVRLYVKEGRRPIMFSTDPSGFDLHYSQFSLESLNREEKLMMLGSRNFFLCPRKASVPTSCSKEVEDTTKISLPWLKFMDFLL